MIVNEIRARIHEMYFLSYNFLSPRGAVKLSIRYHEIKFHLPIKSILVDESF